MGNPNCHVCGKSYDSADVYMYAKTKEVQLSVISMDNPGMRKALGMKSLMKCSNCGKICCADCAKEGAGPTNLVCPACGVPFAVNSFLPPTAQAVSDAPSAAKPEPPVSKPSQPVQEKPAKPGGLFGWLRKKR